MCTADVVICTVDLQCVRSSDALTSTELAQLWSENHCCSSFKSAHCVVHSVNSDRTTIQWFWFKSTLNLTHLICAVQNGFKMGKKYKFSAPPWWGCCMVGLLAPNWIRASNPNFCMHLTGASDKAVISIMESRAVI